MTAEYRPRIRPDLLNSITEKQLQAQVVALCRHYDLAYFHPYDSRRSNPGYPDLTIVGPTGVLWAELKTMKGKLSTHQKTWIERLEAAGLEVHVWRPDQVDDIHDRLRELAGR